MQQKILYTETLWLAELMRGICLNSIGWLRLALPLRVHCCVWGGGDVATLTELIL